MALERPLWFLQVLGELGELARYLARNCDPSKNATVNEDYDNVPT